MIFHENIIIGGGASGLMAAITAKNLNKDVAIIEGTNRIGNKILTTGNGRCNISNSNISSPYNCYKSENNNFYNYCLDTYSVEYIKNIFLSLGLPFVELENGKLYPKSLQASSVVDILKLTIEELNIPIYNNTKVKKIFKNNHFKIQTNNETEEFFSCNKLLLACGGKSAAKTGSDGSGFKLAKDLGHNIIEPFPAIVQLKLDYPYLKALSGIKFNGMVSLIINDKLVRQEFGEILFTDYGISGPPILQISLLASKGLNENKSVKINIDMMNDSSIEDVENFIYGHLDMFSHRTISSALIGIINKKLIPILLKDIGITNIHIPCYELDWKYKQKLCSRLKKWSFTCIGTNGFNSAQLTAGGVDTTFVDNKTLESKIIKNLYFSGEILDVNGDCGGFNLNWAWSSGILVGNNL